MRLKTALITSGGYLFFSALFAGCGQKNPEFVFIAGEGYSHSVAARAEKYRLKVGEEVLLRAKRRSGPYRKIALKELAPGMKWVYPEPPLEEPEVAGSLTWQASPRGIAFFGPWREDRARTVTFSKPGRYELRGYSTGWTGINAECRPLTIVVTPR